MAGLFADPGCSAAQRVQPGQSFTLYAPVEEGGVTLFRQTLYLCLPVDDRCQRVTLAPGAHLNLRFEPQTVAVHQNDGAWVRRWQQQGEQVTIELTYPGPIVKISSDIYAKVALHRVDGKAISEKATTTVATGQTLSEPFVAAVFQAKLSEEKPQAIARKTAERVQQRHKSLSAKAVGAEGYYAVEDAAWHEARMEAMLASALTRLDVQGQPSSPRLRLLSSDQSEVLWQWLEPGVHPNPVSYTAQGEDLVKQWQPALDRALAQRQTGSAQIVLPLQIESDAPCRVLAQQAALDLRLQTQLLSEPVSRTFDGSGTQSEVVTLELPAAQRLALTVEGNAALRSPPLSGALPALAAADQYTGFSLDAGGQLAVAWELAQPLRVGGMAIAWYALSEGTTLQVALSEARDGQPAATALASAAVTVRASVPEWALCRWDELVLQPGRYWLQVALAQGMGVWLGQTVSTPQPVWQPRGADRSGASSLPLQLGFQPLETASSATAIPPVSASLDGLPVALSSPRAEQIALSLASIPPALQSATQWHLALASSEAMIVTVKTAWLSYAAG